MNTASPRGEGGAGPIAGGIGVWGGRRGHRQSISRCQWEVGYRVIKAGESDATRKAGSVMQWLKARKAGCSEQSRVQPPSQT